MTAGGVDQPTAGLVAGRRQRCHRAGADVQQRGAAVVAQKREPAIVVPERGAVAAAVPGALVLVVGGLLASAIFDLSANGVAVVGDVPRGLPAPMLPDYDIVRIYGAEYRGIVNYYRLAQDVWRLGALRWNVETSLLKSLAAKHDSSVSQTAARYKAKVLTRDGLRTCFEARKRREGKPDLVARFGGIPLTRDRRAALARGRRGAAFDTRRKRRARVGSPVHRQKL